MKHSNHTIQAACGALAGCSGKLWWKRFSYTFRGRWTGSTLATSALRWRRRCDIPDL